MSFTRQSDPYSVRLAGDLLKACESGTADFLNPASIPYYTQDMFTSRALPDAAQLQTMLNNAALGSLYINYAPTFMIQDSKRDWMKNIREKINEVKEKNYRETGCIVYKGKDEQGNKHYEMMSPARGYNPALTNESPMNQNPIPDIGICRQTPALDTRDPKGIEKYITGVIGNYFNAAFTKTPYFPPQWGGQETEMLSKALNADPALAIRSAQQAYAQATSVKIENTVNQELNDNVREAMKEGLPPFNTKKQEAVIGPVNINGGNVPANGVDFVNAYYNNLKGAENSNTTVTQNGYVPYQTHNEKPKDIDKFLVEEYGNIMNASLTGTPYSGSVTPAQLKTLSAGIEAKMANDPAYMSGIANKARENVLGFNYMPYDKENFITKARDPSSEEFKILDKMIADHINDMVRNNKMSFNGEFQELSKDLTEKIKNERTPPARTTGAAKTTAAKKDGTPGAAPANSAKKPPTATAKPAAAKKEPPSSAGKAAGADEVKKPSTRTTGAAAAKKGQNQSAGKASGGGAADEVKKPAPRTTRTTGAAPANKGQTQAAGGAVAADEVKKPAARTTRTAGAAVEKPTIVEEPPKPGERPSFLKEVTEFVKKNIVEKKPALILADTFLGTVIDKAKKIVRTGKPIAAAFIIAANVLAPNLHLPIADHVRIPMPNGISISVNRDDFKSTAQGAVKGGGQVRQVQQTKSTARRC
jgi:hypothetical protein